MLLIDDVVGLLAPDEDLIQVRGRDDGKLILCRGIPITFPGWESWTFFLDWRKGTWVVTELVCGCRFAEGSSKQEAAANALEILMAHGREQLAAHIAEKVAKFGSVANPPGRVTARMIRCEECGASYYPWEDHHCTNSIREAA